MNLWALTATEYDPFSWWRFNVPAPDGAAFNIIDPITQDTRIYSGMFNISPTGKWRIVSSRTITGQYNIYRSSNGGQTWQAIVAPDQTDPGSHEGQYAVAIEDNGKVHAARFTFTGSADIVYWSYDGSWSSHVTIYSGIDRNNDRLNYLGTDGNRIICLSGSNTYVLTKTFISTTQGTTWTKLAGATFGLGDFVYIGVQDAHTVWAGPYIHVVATGSGGGGSKVYYHRFHTLLNTWEHFVLPSVPDTVGSYGTNRIFTRHGSTSELYIAFFDHDNPGDFLWLWKSTDSGATWTAVALGEAIPNWRANSLGVIDVFINAGISMGSDDRLHIWGQIRGGGAVPYIVYETNRSLTSSSYSTPVQVGTVPNFGRQDSTIHDENFFPVQRQDGIHERPYDGYLLSQLSSADSPKILTNISSIFSSGDIIKDYGTSHNDGLMHNSYIADQTPIHCGEATTINSNFESFGTYMWQVPADCHQIIAEVWGGAGGEAFPSSGPNRGKGGYVKATFDVFPGEILQVIVGDDANFDRFGGDRNGGLGGRDGAGSTGGGGGGSSEIRRAPYHLDDKLIVAGGGGGANGNRAVPGGDAGYPTGTRPVSGLFYDAWAGYGGTQTAGGVSVPGAFGSYGGTGTQLFGGAGGEAGNFQFPGGGGGGGFWGGAGGGDWGAGGGGSSKAIDPTCIDIVYLNGVNNGVGRVNIIPLSLPDKAISFPSESPAAYMSVDPAPYTVDSFTFLAMVKQTNSRSCVLANLGQNSTDSGWSLIMSPTKLSLDINGTEVSFWNGTSALNTAFLIGFTYENGIVRLFKNGCPVNELLFVEPIDFTANEFVFGQSIDDIHDSIDTQSFVGLYDEALFFDRVLSDSEMRSLSNAGCLACTDMEVVYPIMDDPKIRKISMGAEDAL